MAKKRTPAQIAAEKAYDKTRPKPVATRYSDAELKLLDAAMKEAGLKTRGAVQKAIVLKALGSNQPPKRARRGAGA